MADPVSMAASVLTLATAAFTATQSLCDTVKRWKGRDKALGRLQAHLEEMNHILASLAKVTDIEESLWRLLQGPIARCSQVCQDFELSMKKFGQKQKTGIIDWGRMEFMRGDISDFIDRISGYKSTITVGLGIITLHSSRASNEVLQTYMEMVKDTAHDLSIQMQRIDEKMSQTTDTNPSQEVPVDLNDEKEVTQQCLRICQDAKAYIESLTSRESSLLPEAPRNADEDVVQVAFAAQVATRRAFEQHRDKMSEIIGSILNRLETLVQDGGPEHREERIRLQQDMDASRQCFEICKVATELSQQKIYKVAQAEADDNSDHVVVNTFSDLFEVGKTKSTNNSAMLVASLTSEDFRHAIEQRYKSRFGATVGDSSAAKAGSREPPSPNQASRKREDPQQTREYGKRQPELEPDRRTPSSNEVRRRFSKEEDK